MKINGYAIPVIPIALVAAVITGAVAYGQQKEKVDNNSTRIEELEKTPLKVWEIAKDQAVMQKDLDALNQKQEVFRDATIKSLDRILRKLDE